MNTPPRRSRRHFERQLAGPAAKSALSVALAVALASTAQPATAAPSSTGRPAACAVPAEPGSFEDGSGSATLTVTTVDDDCLRTYRLVSSLAGERVFSEAPGKPTLRSGSVLLDGLYAMAHDDAELNETDQVVNKNYNHGNPVPCPGGCYITGKYWTYVWTRDVSYSADLGLSAVDPERRTPCRSS